jgi:hypothetical protein
MESRPSEFPPVENCGYQPAPPATKDKIHAGTTRFEIRNLKF